jgi:hypothetical protein
MGGPDCQAKFCLEECRRKVILAIKNEPSTESRFLETLRKHGAKSFRFGKPSTGIGAVVSLAGRLAQSKALDSAGINRRGVANERVAQGRSSQPP